MFENAQLQNKLENLENVFIGTSINRTNGANKSQGFNNGGPIANGSAQDAAGLQQDYKISNLIMENNDLKKRIYQLEHEKIEL